MVAIRIMGWLLVIVRGRWLGFTLNFDQLILFLDMHPIYFIYISPRRLPALSLSCANLMYCVDAVIRAREIARTGVHRFALSSDWMRGAALGQGGSAGGNGADSRAGKAGGVARGSMATCRAAEY